MKAKKGHVESGLLLLVVIAHIAVLGLIWLAPNLATGTTRQDLTLVVAPVTAAYFLAGVRFAIKNQSAPLNPQEVNLTYLIVVVIVVLTYLGGVVGTVAWRGFSSAGIKLDDVKIVVGIIETFMGGAFALIAEDIFREKVERPAVSGVE